MQSARALLRRAGERLVRAGFENAAIDARVMLSCASGKSVEELLLNPALELPQQVQDVFEAMVNRRLSREPVAYIVTEKEFWGLNIKLPRRVLIPRPDTETLIELVLKLLPDRDAVMKIADFGTGSGCILAALLHEYKNSSGIGIDSSDDAVFTAETNFAALGFASRAEVIKSNWDDSLPEDMVFDLIVSNPPYITASDVAGLMGDVRDFEPHIALDGGADGFDCYRAVAAAASRRLTVDGMVALEAGVGQADGIKKIFEDSGLGFVASGHDLQGIERALIFNKRYL